MTDIASIIVFNSAKNSQSSNENSSRCTSSLLTHWGRVTHICVGKLTIIGSDNGLKPGLRQAIFWTNDGILLIGPLGTNFNEILIEILIFSFKKMHSKVSSANRRPFCPGLNVVTSTSIVQENAFQLPPIWAFYVEYTQWKKNKTNWQTRSFWCGM